MKRFPTYVLGRIRELIAKATSPDVLRREAMEAALLAVTLIRNHGLRVEIPYPAMHAAHEVRASIEHQRKHRYRVYPESAYDGVCRACDLSFYVGDPVAWRKGLGTTHTKPQCVRYWEKKSADDIG